METDDTQTSPAERRTAAADRLLGKLAEHGRLSAADAKAATGLPEAAARTVIRELSERGQVRPRGQGRARTYALAH